MAIVEKLTTAPSFINGVAVPAGTKVSIDTDVVELADDDPNLKDVDPNWTPPAPIVMGAIGPTGPNPTAPQQLAPGMVQTLDGYATPNGTPVVGEGSLQAREAGVEPIVEEGGPSTGTRTAYSADGSVEELKAHLATVNSTDEIEALRKAETEGKNRSTAHTAIDARANELNALS